MSTYNRVKVLLLKWEDDDLQINDEVNRLAYVFSARRPDGYNFITESWSIPSGLEEGDDPEDLLNNRLLQFRRGATERDLLILYYGGHGRGTPQNLIWFANQQEPDPPSLNWHNLQGLLLGSRASVLFILDCCYADLGVSSRGSADNWMFGATTRSDPATGAGYNSFTSTLTRELERCAHLFYEQGEQTSVQSLHSSLSRWDRDLRYSPILTRLGDDDLPAIKVVPDIRPRLYTASTDPVSHTVAPHPTNSSPQSNGLRSGPIGFRKKESVYGKLRSYDTKFLVDDSASMYGENWTTVREAVAAIARIAVDHDSDGVDVQFFTAFIPVEERQNLKNVADIMRLFLKVDPYGETPTADKLEEELGEYCRHYQRNRDIKGFNLIVLTDGDPSPGQDVKAVLVHYARRLAELGAPKLHVGVQFVQIGDDEKARSFLKELDDDLKGTYDLDRDVSIQSAFWPSYMH